MQRELKQFSFTDLTVPASPNWFLACPPQSGLAACKMEAPVYPMPMTELQARFFEVASAEARVALIADQSVHNRYRFTQKSRLFKFVDEITVEFVELTADTSSLYLLGRSRVGWWDMGVNARRVRRWLRKLGRR
ncbi:DUF1499 domain-containing protein [Aquibaculum sediminis]|uniref:DUF1499 domain-containing protein n=1 Tax=Aquibaculum sediminis TaxID=3231907 RepID=UPI00345276B9